MSLPVIDTHEFTRRGDRAEGSVELSALARVDSMRVGRDGELRWRLEGWSVLGAAGSRISMMHLHAQGRIEMACVRCLEPVEVSLTVDRSYRLVASEEQAAREDVEDDETDVLVASRSFDLSSLLEDELIMALPFAPRHADCRVPEEGATPAATVSVEPVYGAREPFAELGRLRGLLPTSQPDNLPGQPAGPRPLPGEAEQRED